MDILHCGKHILDIRVVGIHKLIFFQVVEANITGLGKCVEFYLCKGLVRRYRCDCLLSGDCRKVDTYGKHPGYKKNTYSKRAYS